MSDDPFDSKSFALTPEQLTKLEPLQKKTNLTKPRGRSGNERFVILPYKLALKAAGQLGEPAFAVLVELAHRRFKMHRNPVPLANEELAAAGISRWMKNRALKRLEEIGLVEVDRRRGRSPRVTTLF